MAIGGSNGNYPTLMAIANLVRTLVNDDKQGASGTPGEGQILTNSSTTLQELLDNAIEEVYQDCRIVNDPTLIKDQYIITNIPPVNSPLGVGVMNPAVQTALTFNGYFDGLQMLAYPTLPSDMLYPLAVWERQGGTKLPFQKMANSGGELSPRNQFLRMGEWEWRTDSIWFHGAILPVDLRLRYIATYVPLLTNLAGLSIGAVNTFYQNTYVPISNSRQAIADKIAARYVARLGGDALQYAEGRADKSILRLKQQIVKSRQVINYQQAPYGGNRPGQAGDPAQYLY